MSTATGAHAFLAIVVRGGLMTSLALKMVVVTVLFRRWGLRPARAREEAAL